MTRTSRGGSPNGSSMHSSTIGPASGASRPRRRRDRRRSPRRRTASGARAPSSHRSRRRGRHRARGERAQHSRVKKRLMSPNRFERPRHHTAPLRAPDWPGQTPRMSQPPPSSPGTTMMTSSWPSRLLPEARKITRALNTRASRDGSSALTSTSQLERHARPREHAREAIRLDRTHAARRIGGERDDAAHDRERVQLVTRTCPRRSRPRRAAPRTPAARSR